MYNKIRFNQKNILIVTTISIVVLFCFILYKSYKISKIKENINELPIIKSNVEIIKIKKETKELKPEINSFYNNLDNSDNSVNIIKDSITTSNTNNFSNTEITNADTIDNTIDNIINNELEDNATNNNTIVIDDSIKTVVINEQNNLNSDTKTRNKQQVEINNNYYRAQLIALKNKQQAHNFVEKTKKMYGNILKNLNVSIFEIDLGEKGIFYRVQVGNFNTKSDASKFCDEYLKITIKSPTNCIVVK